MHTDTRTKAISRNQACTAFGRAPGLKSQEYTVPLNALSHASMHRCVGSLYIEINLLGFLHQVQHFDEVNGLQHTEDYWYWVAKSC